MMQPPRGESLPERGRADRAHATFIANAAHELRTPLAALSGFASLLYARWGEMSEEQIKECLEGMQRQGERAKTLITNLLDLSLLEAGTEEFELAPVDLAAVVASTLELFGTADGVRIESALEPGLSVRADAQRLEQVLVNLLTNALRYGGDSIEVTAVGDGDDVVLTVADDGEGVAPALVDQLFEPFVRGQAVGRALGSGLGLAIVRRVVELMGGTVSYEDRPGGGARFVMRLSRSAPVPGP